MPAPLDRKIYQGDSKVFVIGLWSNRYKRVAFDLTGATVAGQVRAAPGSTVLATLACTVLEPLVEGGPRNRVRVELTAAASAALAVSEALYDVQATLADGRIYTLLAGKLYVTPDITRLP